ncbi:MAG TPA: TetR/AcrR family transcriptional regulator [Pseudomonas sp.]|uniref:TetR/AcrR family transcriptional regulator n=1 Tax=Pseudomonas sp. TaxID=306 RepID=UPI002B45911A|nr:TetR/AcrR family transcriptional regulator [Pseudomonas sp.]HKS14346.1 TetR/AcrR family transcriptional regulator [Pseudomonas sp.]
MPASCLAPTSSPHARDRLLEAATTLFALHGYQAVSLRDLAAHLGLQAGSLYHHIESKQGLLFELIESSLTDLLYDTRRCLKGVEAHDERLKCFVQAFVTYSQAYPDRLVLVTREMINLKDDQRAHIEQLRTAYSGFLRDIVAAECGLSPGRSGEKAASIAHAVLGMLCGQAHWRRPGDSQESLASLLATYALGIVRTGAAA